MLQTKARSHGQPSRKPTPRWQGHARLIRLPNIQFSAPRSETAVRRVGLPPQTPKLAWKSSGQLFRPEVPAGANDLNYECQSVHFREKCLLQTTLVHAQRRPTPRCPATWRVVGVCGVVRGGVGVGIVARWWCKGVGVCSCYMFYNVFLNVFMCFI